MIKKQYTFQVLDSHLTKKTPKKQNKTNKKQKQTNNKTTVFYVTCLNTLS